MIVFSCPSCGTPLEIVAGEAGFAIVGVDREEQRKAALRPPEDPVMQLYTKWQERAAYALAAAVGCAFVLFLDVKSSYLSYGFFFWKNPDNLILIYIVSSLFLLLLLGGGIVFFTAAKRKRMRREHLAARESTTDPKGGG